MKKLALLILLLILFAYSPLIASAIWSHLAKTSTLIHGMTLPAGELTCMMASGTVSHHIRIFLVLIMAVATFGHFSMLRRFRDIMGIDHPPFIIR